MTFEQFDKFMTTMHTQIEKEHNISMMGVSVFEFNESYQSMISILMNEVWSKPGIEWIEWFMWESDFGQRDWSKVSHLTNDTNDYSTSDGYGAHDEEGNPICYDVKSLYEYIKQFEKQTMSEKLEELPDEYFEGMNGYPEDLFLLDIVNELK